MSTTYKTVSGDTFERIAQKIYGSEIYASLVRQANPGTFEPIPVGRELNTPAQPDGPINQPQTTLSSGVDEAVLTILGKRYRFWDSLTLKRSIDSVDTLELTAPFEPDNEEFRRLFKPFSYPQVTLTIGTELVFTGTQIVVRPSNTADGRAVAAAAYSLPGVLEDCCPPASMYSDDDSLEFENLDLRTIATRLLAPFGLRPVFMVSPGAVFELVSIKATQEVMPFLAKLAKLRAIVITSNAKGELIFWKTNTGGRPVANFSDTDGGPMVSIDPEFKEQAYYSHITGIDPASVGSAGGQYTVVNSRLKGAVRPFTFETTDSETNDETITVATEGKVGRMFGDAVSYTVELNTWRDSYGKLWEPNTTVVVRAPGVMIYKPYEFLIRDVEHRRNANGATASLTLVLPDAYRGKVPESLPWDS